MDIITAHESDVVMAEEIKTFSFEIELIEVTKILIKCKTSDKTYLRYIHENDEWWQENKLKFQANFNLLFKIVKNSLIKSTDDIVYTIYTISEDTVELNIKYSNLFSFEINIELQTRLSLQGHRIKELEKQSKEDVKRIKELETENEMLKQGQNKEKTNSVTGELCFCQCFTLSLEDDDEEETRSADSAFTAAQWNHLEAMVRKMKDDNLTAAQRRHSAAARKINSDTAKRKVNIATILKPRIKVRGGNCVHADGSVHVTYGYPTGPSQ